MFHPLRGMLSSSRDGNTLSSSFSKMEFSTKQKKNGSFSSKNSLHYHKEN